MAIYHFHVTQIKRSAGSSAVASAAYRAGERLYSERYDECNDYTKKGGVLCSEVLLPPHAPETYQDRQTLWNAVEAAEKRGDAQLAYSFDIALPNELSQGENVELARQFVQENFVRKGMIADYAVHDPDRGQGGISNPHFHVMCPIRPIDPEGKWGEKQRQKPVMDENGNPVWDDKQHRYKYNAVATTDWGSPETLEQWRENWCRMCNEKLTEKGVEDRIDHRSYECQGVEQMAQVHEGVTVRAMEIKGIPTEKGEFNRFVRATNDALKSIRKKLSELAAWILEVRQEMELSADRSPSVRRLLLTYMEQMKVGAMAFPGRARNKASVTTLKDVAASVAYLDAAGIDTLDQLETRLKSMTDRTDQLLASMKAKSDRMRVLKDALSQYKIYEDTLPVAQEMQKPKYRFKKIKEAYQEEHESDLRLFYRARRVLKEAGITQPVDSDQIQKIRKELAVLENEYQSDYSTLKPLREEKNQLQHIRYCVDRVIRFAAPEAAKERADRIDPEGR